MSRIKKSSFFISESRVEESDWGERTHRQPRESAQHKSLNPITYDVCFCNIFHIFAVQLRLVIFLSIRINFNLNLWCLIWGENLVNWEVFFNGGRGSEGTYGLIYSSKMFSNENGANYTWIPGIFALWARKMFNSIWNSIILTRNSIKNHFKPLKRENLIIKRVFNTFCPFLSSQRLMWQKKNQRES